MVAPEDLLVAAVATSLHRKPPRRRPAFDRSVIEGAIAAWKRIRGDLFGAVRYI